MHGVGTPTDGTVRVRVSQDWSGILCLTADHPLRAQAEREARAAFDTRQSLVIDVDDGEVTALARRPWITKAEPKTTPAAAGKPPAKPSAATTPAKAKAPPATP